MPEIAWCVLIVWCVYRYSWLCRHSPTLVDGLWALPVVQLAAGDAHSAALTSSGHMFVWGSNHFGQLGLVRDGDPNSLRSRRK